MYFWIGLISLQKFFFVNKVLKEHFVHKEVGLLKIGCKSQFIIFRIDSVSENIIKYQISDIGFVCRKHQNPIFEYILGLGFSTVYFLNVVSVFFVSHLDFEIILNSIIFSFIFPEGNRGKI